MSTYTPIASQTLSTSAPSVTFSSIPQGYSDIVLVVQATSSGEIFMRFNSDTGANYSGTEIWTGGSGVNSQRASNENYMTLRDFSTTLGNNMSVANIMNYSNSTTNKTVLIRTNDNRYSRVYARVSLWRNTSAINQITLFNSSGTFASGSTFSLYGIAGGDVTAKAAGGIVTTSGSYTYHTFTSSGRFIPSENLTADILVIAGGGGGGGHFGQGYRGSGGGGAGGLLNFTSQNLTANTGYSVTVGAGGAGGYSNTSQALSGTNSQFGTLTTVIGGGFGVNQYVAGEITGGNGGSGGGGAFTAGGTATTSQGNNGGTSTGNAGGGGGGAGAAGGSTSTGNGGNGGIGVDTYSTYASATSTGASGYYAGGGGGGLYTTGTAGTGGTGGGGAAGTTANGVSGLTNTGGGGGAAGYENSNLTGGAGGSGLVIVRYLT